MTTYAAWPYNLCQMGQEVTPGTAVTPTSLWRGPFGGFGDDRTRESIQEDIGIMAPAERTYDGFLAVSVPMPETGMTFEQFPHILQGSLGKVLPTGSNPYTWLYRVPTDGTSPILQPYTLVLGNRLASSDVRVLPYCFVADWEAKGEAGKNWTISANWKGARYTAGTFATIALPTVEDVVFAKTKLYIDAAGGTIGTTQKLGVLLGASIKYTSGIEMVPVGDGNLYAVAHKIGKPSVSISLKLEVEQAAGVSIVAQERAFHDSNTPRLIRLDAGGSGSKKMIFDLAALYDNFGKYEKQGEQDTAVTIDGHCDYNSAADLFFAATIINTLSAIP